jgi:hypothetical protein
VPCQSFGLSSQVFATEPSNTHIGHRRRDVPTNETARTDDGHTWILEEKAGVGRHSV